MRMLHCSIFNNLVAVQFPLYTLMVYDCHNNGIPVAFFVPSSATGSNVAAFLAAFKAACRKKLPNFAFNCMLTDNDAAQLQALRQVTKANLFSALWLLLFSAHFSSGGVEFQKKMVTWGHPLENQISVDMSGLVGS